MGLALLSAKTQTLISLLSVLKHLPMANWPWRVHSQPGHFFKGQ